MLRVSGSGSFETGRFVGFAKGSRVTPWSRSRRKVIQPTATGSVFEAGGGVYRVQLDDGAEIHASLRGRLKQSGNPVVTGDRVSVLEGQDVWTIESVDPRKPELVRRGRGGRNAKVLVANLDRVFAVLALGQPPVRLDLIDRLLVLIEASGMSPILVLNKLDLDGAPTMASEFKSLYEGIDYKTLSVSAVTGDGLEPLRSEIMLGASVLIGPSRVGKSSLLNALDPELGLRTHALSRKSGGGRHTTVSSRMIRLTGGGLIADTPLTLECAVRGFRFRPIALPLRFNFSFKRE